MTRDARECEESLRGNTAKFDVLASTRTRHKVPTDRTLGASDKLPGTSWRKARGFTRGMTAVPSA